jgi:transposase
MDAVSSEAKRRNQLPDLDSLDVASLKALVLAKHTEIENLNLLVLKLKRMHFGQRSEKMNADIAQLELRLEDLETNQAATEPLPAQLAVLAVNGKTARKPARRPLPAELPRETETIAPQQESCPDCGGTLRPLGEDVSEVLEYVPARFKVIRTVRPKLSCACCSRIVQEPAPHRPIDKGLAGPGLLAHVLVAKYADHLPLYRQSEIYAREGVDLDRSTMADWVGGASRTLRPLVEALKSYVLSAEKLHGDDVPVPVLEPGNGKTKTGRLWTYVRDDRPAGSNAASAVWFAYSPDRKGELSRHPAGRWLRRLQQAVRDGGHLRGRMLGSRKKKVLRPAPGACFAGGERCARTHRAVVWNRERDQRPIARRAKRSPAGEITAVA